MPRKVSVNTTQEESINTSCCIVGGGPAGVVLSLLLARQGVCVKLLEAHDDFDRDFRGDTLHPSTMEYMDRLGLAEKILAIPHAKVHQAEILAGERKIQMADFSMLKTKYPYVTVVPQAKFLDLLVNESTRYPNFSVKMQANVRRLIEEDGICRGVMYQSGDDWKAIRADLTVACDGRFSTIRKLAKLDPISLGAPMDILWFRLPRKSGDGDGLTGRIRNHHMLVAFSRGDHWQLGYVIFKGAWTEVKAHGLQWFRNSIANLMPEIADRTDQLTDWKQISPLSVESSRLRQWHRPGLLFIGDAAHVMSPVGGVGINYAIQDAVAAANVLSSPLRNHSVMEKHLKQIQRQREFPTKLIQWFQTQAQDRIIKSALDPSHVFRIPWFVRLPLFRRIIPYLLAFGWRRPKIHESGVDQKST